MGQIQSVKSNAGQNFEAKQRKTRSEWHICPRQIIDNYEQDEITKVRFLVSA